MTKNLNRCVDDPKRLKALKTCILYNNESTLYRIESEK
jgi:hypothetical protein